MTHQRPWLHARDRRIGGGFTLVEMMTSLVVATVLFVAMGSALVVATHAIPNEDDAVGKLLQSNRALQDFADELQHAKYITAASPAAVTFVLPDRTGNGLPEVIRYAWGGTPGDPLIRTANSGSAMNVLEDVQDLNLVFITKAVTQTYPGKPEESGLQTLSMYTSVSIRQEISVNKWDWLSQYFEPTLPAGALGWRVKDVWIYGQVDGVANQETLVQLREANADRTPTDTVLREFALPESSLPVGRCQSPSRAA